MKPQGKTPENPNPVTGQVGNNPKVVPSIENIIELKQKHSWAELSKLTGYTMGQLRYLYLKAKNNGSKQKLPFDTPKPVKEKIQDTDQMIVSITLEAKSKIKNLKGNDLRNTVKNFILEKMSKYELTEKQFREIAVQIYQKVMNTKSKNFVHVFGREALAYLPKEAKQ